jgi:hypothetical protein
MLPKLKKGALILTTKVFSVDSSIEDFIFDFPHTLGEIEVDATLMRIKVQDMKVECWNLLEDV